MASTTAKRQPPINPNVRQQQQQDQAARLEPFLGRLAADDDVLLDYLNRREDFLRDEVKAGNLWVEDAALLLEGSYSRVREVMSHCSQGIVWVSRPWHF